MHMCPLLINCDAVTQVQMTLQSYISHFTSIPGTPESSYSNCCLERPSVTKSNSSEGLRDASVMALFVTAIHLPLWQCPYCEPFFPFSSSPKLQPIPTLEMPHCSLAR